jgi:hypothetical protein
MKTAICIDSLLNRDEATFILELVLNIFPNSEIYTIAHKRGGILGTIETRSIVSSFLSHKVAKGDVLKKHFWILPSAVKAIPMHPSIEKVIVISRGYIHGLIFPAHVKPYLYILDWNLVDQKTLGWQKMFASYVNLWRERALTRFPKIAVSSEALKTKLELPNAEVIQPTFRTEEYPFVKDEDHNFLFTHHLVLTHGMSEGNFKLLMRMLTAKGETVRTLGPEDHLKTAKEEFKTVDFAGDHCEATTAMYSHQAKVVWSLSESFFPSAAFGALCTGRPVIVMDTPVNREYLSKGCYFLPQQSEAEFEKIYQQISTAESMDRKELRRLGLKWNERLFKSRMVRFLERAQED